MRIIVSLMVIGLVVFTIGLVKSLGSKCRDMGALVWLWSGVGLINIATVLSGALL